MRRHTLDNHKVSCPNAHFMGRHNRLTAKRGDGVLFAPDEFSPPTIARVLGRIKTVDSDGENCVGWLSVVVPSADFTFTFIRWIPPSAVRAVFDLPKKVPERFFSGDCGDGQLHESIDELPSV